MKQHPFIHRLKETYHPDSQFMADLLRYQERLNKAFQKKDYFAQADILAGMLYKITTDIKHPARTTAEKLLAQKLKEYYQASIEMLQALPEPDACLCSAIAVHRYFVQKLEAYQSKNDTLSACKLTYCSSLLLALAKRHEALPHYQRHNHPPRMTFDEALSEKLSQMGYGAPARFAHYHSTCSNKQCRDCFEWHIDNIVERHAQECARHGVTEGKFGLLLQWVRDDKLRTDTMPALQTMITQANVPGIQAYFIAEKNKVQTYSFFQRRWLDQLSQTKANPVEYYQRWTEKNPYQHAKSLALRQTAIYTGIVVILAISINLAIAASTAGIGNLIALAAAYACVSSTPGAYGLVVGVVACTTARLSYRHHLQQYTFKQQAIQDCIASEPVTAPEKSMP